MIPRQPPAEKHTSTIPNGVVRGDQAPDLQLLINSTPSLIHTSRPDGCLDFFNQNLANVRRAVVGGFAGLEVDSVHSSRGCRRNRGKVARVSGQRRADEYYRWYLVRYIPLHDDKGLFNRWYVASTDLDERKRAEEKLQEENVALREEIDKASMFEEIVGTSRSLGRKAALKVRIRTDRRAPNTLPLASRTIAMTAESSGRRRV
jgi:hypothetical protein